MTMPVEQSQGYVEHPNAAGPWPGVVVIHEAFGLDDNIRALTDRVAALGYVALAPDFFDGQNWLRCIRRAMAELHGGSGRFFDAIEAARSSLAARPDCTGKVGVIGFCLGGGFALAAAPRYDFGAVSVNYGEVPGDAERALVGSCPIVGSYGGRDRTLRDDPARLETALTRLGVEHDVKVYPEAGHSFLNVKRYPMSLRVLSEVTGLHAGPHEPSADDAWDRIGAFFGRHLS
jgi:carboxymethylenebutenolidase